MNLGLALYRAAATAAFPFIKGRLERSHSVGSAERCGAYSDEKLTKIKKAREAGGGKNFWLHAVSVGEVQAVSPIVRAMRSDGWDGAITLSTVTVTGANIAERLLGGEITSHVYAPWDVPSIAAAVCDALHPTAYATVETEVWPNLLFELNQRGVPTFLVNARVSDRTWQKSGQIAKIYRSAYGMFDLVLARGLEDARRLGEFGVPPERLRVTGDSKIDAILSRRGEASFELPDIRARLSISSGDIVFVAGSTHEGEDETVLKAYAALKAEPGFERARLVVAPRHPERAGDVLELARLHGSAALYSDSGGANDEAPPDIIVVDEIGVLYGLYGVASSAFIGGSLVPNGGQNILEPASWGVPVLHGPHMDDFAEPTRQLDESGDAIKIENSVGMAEALKKSLSERHTVAGAQILRPLPPYFEKNAGAAMMAWKMMAERVDMSCIIHTNA